MSWVLPRTEKTSRRSQRTDAPAHAAAGKPHRSSCVKFTQLVSRLTCGLLAAMHIAPLLRVSRHIMEQGPTPTLVVSGAVLALLIGVLTAKAAGLVFLRKGSRRASTISLFLACAIFHGDALATKDVVPTVAVLTTAATAVIAIKVARKLREELKGRGLSFEDLFPANIWALLSPEPRAIPLCLVASGPRRPRGPPCA